MSKKFAPKTNISKTYYKHLVDQIEHDPLINHSTISVACLVAAISVLFGGLVWFAKANPGNLIQTNGTITGVSSGKTDTSGGTSTFITYDFKTREDKPVSVRSQIQDSLVYSVGQNIKVGYHPKNSNFARNLADNRPPRIATTLWTIPVMLMIWFGFVALFRHHKRQMEIWDAAEAANSDD